MVRTKVLYAQHCDTEIHKSNLKKFEESKTQKSEEKKTVPQTRIEIEEEIIEIISEDDEISTKSYLGKRSWEEFEDS